MKIRRMREVFLDRAEGDCCGLPYATELAGSAGCSIVFWCGDRFDEARLQTALRVARANLDVVYAHASLGMPTGYWAHQDMPELGAKR